MTMLREFFDITEDSHDIFEGLAIMDTEYAAQMNSRPVICLTLKDCRGDNAESLRASINQCLVKVFGYYETFFGDRSNLRNRSFIRYFELLDKLTYNRANYNDLAGALDILATAVRTCFDMPVFLLIDEYDMPIVSSYEYGYREELGTFFSRFFGSVLKGNSNVGRSLLTGVQRVAKESIFSGVNNIEVFTVLDDVYSTFFGLTEAETKKVLQDFGLELTEAVRSRYDGYRFGGVEIYNPLSLLSYASSGRLANYWINTSTNALVFKSIEQAGISFKNKFDRLVQFGEVIAPVDLQTSIIELSGEGTLWGLLVNAGYLTIAAMPEEDSNLSLVRIANGEVRREFMKHCDAVYKVIEVVRGNIGGEGFSG